MGGRTIAGNSVTISLTLEPSCRLGRRLDYALRSINAWCERILRSVDGRYTWGRISIVNIRPSLETPWGYFYVGLYQSVSRIFTAVHASMRTILCHEFVVPFTGYFRVTLTHILIITLCYLCQYLCIISKIIADIYFVYELDKLYVIDKIWVE